MLFYSASAYLACYAERCTNYDRFCLSVCVGRFLADTIWRCTTSAILQCSVHCTIS